MVAGCSRYTTVYGAKQGSYQEFRSQHKDAQKLRILFCPCGGGVQDSLHVLACTHSALVELRRRVLEVTEKCVLQWGGTAGSRSAHDPSPHVGYKHHTTNPDTTARRVAEGRQREANKRKRAISDDEEANWLTMTKTQKLLISLGSDSMWLPWELCARIVAESASYWGDVETTYAAINGVV